MSNLIAFHVRAIGEDGFLRVHKVFARNGQEAQAKVLAREDVARVDGALWHPRKSRLTARAPRKHTPRVRA